MLSKYAQIVNIDPEQYERLAESVAHLLPYESDKPVLIVFFKENRAVHAVHSEKGPLESVDFKGPGGLDRLAAEHGVERVVCVESGAVRRVFTKAQSSLRHDQRMWDQILACRAAFMSELNTGIHIYPDPFKSFPAAPDLLLKLIRKVFPQKLIITVCVMERGEVWTSLILGIQNGEATLITTTDSLDEMKINHADIRSAASGMTAETALKWGAPAAGFFMERVAFQQLLASPDPLSEFLSLVRNRWIYIKPFSLKLKLAIYLLSILKERPRLPRRS